MVHTLSLIPNISPVIYYYNLNMYIKLKYLIVIYGNLLHIKFYILK
jgi:hypothetical protein